MLSTAPQADRSADIAVLPVRGHLDVQSAQWLAGWALQGPAPLTVEARLGDQVIASVSADRPRPDLGAAFPDEQNSATCGFELLLPPVIGGEGLFSDIVLLARQPDRTETTEIGRLTLPGKAALSRALAVANDPRTPGPFPREITNIVDALWPGSADGLDDEAGQANFVDRLRALFEMPQLQSIEAVARYARYLRAIWSHFTFVATHFPADNNQRDVSAKDYNCRSNSPNELMSIAHQLYVLKSYGIEGDFAEFGCFKGFSSSMLSQACAMLGIRMHIFDSFEGLPDSGSAYYEAGDFAGSLDEVQRNIAVFGAPQAVTFHKGFFSASLKAMTPPPLMCLWMDVDLEVSARDLLVAIDQLAPEGNLFSHECAADMFEGGRIVVQASADNPIPPVLDKFEALGRPLSGRFITGNTGAFWPRDGGTRVIANRVLIDLILSL